MNQILWSTDGFLLELLLVLFPLESTSILNFEVLKMIFNFTFFIFTMIVLMIPPLFFLFRKKGTEQFKDQGPWWQLLQQKRPFGYILEQMQLFLGWIHKFVGHCFDNYFMGPLEINLNRSVEQLDLWRSICTVFKTLNRTLTNLNRSSPIKILKNSYQL